MNITRIFKRKKPMQKMPEPNFDDNWKQEQFEKKVKQGVSLLQIGKEVEIYDDGRGYELACEIKRQFILEYQKKLSEKIKIEGNSVIRVRWDNAL